MAKTLYYLVDIHSAISTPLAIPTHSGRAGLTSGAGLLTRCGRSDRRRVYRSAQPKADDNHIQVWRNCAYLDHPLYALPDQLKLPDQ